ncbi:MAG: alpha/beta fold hydrolase [Actinomycetota bacterium]
MPESRNTVPRRTLALVLALAVVAAACTGGGDDDGDEAEEAVTTTATTVTPTTPTTEAEPEPIDPAAGESVALDECFVDIAIECGTVPVPLDHDDPSAGTIDIAIGIHRATSPADRIGYLFVNPGGPGGSGIEYAVAAAFGPDLAFTAEVIERFDIVGFDPRGVAESEPAFGCGAAGDQLELLNQIDGPVDTEAEVDLSERAAALCVDTLGPAAALLGTASVARDMDVIREALGAEQINYLGASYGSTVGVFYATLFPERVRAMVVDGADNPVDDLSDEAARIESALQEIRQFEALLNEALLACDTPDCPAYNDGDPIGFYLDQVDDLGLVNEAFADDPTAGGLAVITPLYSEDTWPELWRGLAALSEGDAQPLIDLAAFQLLGREPGAANFTAHVNCLDRWALHPDFDRATQLGDRAAVEAAALEELPLLSALDLLTAPDPCPFYDTTVLDGVDPFDGPLDGSDVPILVIGNRSDPATPFTESAELVDQTLSNGHLVEVDHPQHVVYPQNPCVNDTIHAVLIDGRFPTGDRTDCPAGVVGDSTPSE